MIHIIKGNKVQSLETISRNILSIYQSLTLPWFYQKLIQRTGHIALVVDEYVGNEGFVTLESGIETILGLKIVDETDNIEGLQIASPVINGKSVPKK